MGRPEELFEDLRDRGEAAINEFIVRRASEELYLDFKRSADEGNGAKLAQNDRANLAKAISGFGNTAGGVIVWGIDCRTDSTDADVVGQTHYPVVDAAKFKSWLENAVAGDDTLAFRGAACSSGTAQRSFRLRGNARSCL